MQWPASREAGIVLQLVLTGSIGIQGRGCGSATSRRRPGARWPAYAAAVVRCCSSCLLSGLLTQDCLMSSMAVIAPVIWLVGSGSRLLVAAYKAASCKRGSTSLALMCPKRLCTSYL